ncbi:hypothetical protein PV327_008099 [Microctonus hyperodae]|uniref:ATP synthase-coupling factor B n=1 Tax=Microctonus hyperodae TaxID=165561 RepID=A0AA39KGI7_MICHY|nr:hypothetical protein PV327_008099 [Microctonus hyperodae]
MLTIRLSKRSSAVLSSTIHRFYSSSLTHEDDDEEKNKNARKLKKWRNENRPTHTGLLSMFDTKSDDEGFFKINRGFKTTNFSSWYKEKQREYLEWCQRYIEERHQSLGNQLAITHFILHRGGKVKQKGVADYLCQDDIPKLPTTFTPNWVIDEIDFSGSEICYSGLDNFRNLSTLRKISFKSCKYFDDWCLEKFIFKCPGVEYLDISECENITARGIESLYRSSYLKNLIVSNFDNNAEFELTCLMLEDCTPGLTIEIIKTPNVNEISVQ